MSPTIRISDDVYEHLQQHAEPFIDTPDSVLRRLLRLDGTDSKETTAETIAPNGAGATENGGSAQAVRAERSAPLAPAAAANGADEPKRSSSSGGSRSWRRIGANRSGPPKAPRAPRGSLVKDAAYELPILQVLAERGGRAGKNEVIDALEPIIGDRLTGLDRTPLGSGEIRWRNRAQFVRLRLVQRGEMEKGSPRGIWELSDAGRARLAASDVPTADVGAR